MHPSSWITMPLAFTILEDLKKLEYFYIFKFRGNLNNEIHNPRRNWNHGNCRKMASKTRRGKKGKTPNNASYTKQHEGIVDTKYKLLGPDTWQASSLMTLMVEMGKHWMGNTAKVEYNIQFTRHKETDCTAWNKIDWKFGHLQVAMASGHGKRPGGHGKWPGSHGQ